MFQNLHRNRQTFSKNSRIVVILLTVFLALSYSLCKQQSNDQVIIREGKDRIEAWVANRPVMVYHTATVKPPRNEAEYYQRSGFFHPLYSPSGLVLTDDFPVGHVHQHGLFFAWTNVTFKGEHIDFWNQHEGKGTVKHVEVLDVQSGSDVGIFKVRQQQVSLVYGPVLDDIWTVRVLNRSNPFVLDFEIEQQCATDVPVFINEYHYGGFAYRGQEDWNKESSDLFKAPMNVLTREGKKKETSNHTRPGWIVAWGEIGDRMAGIGILDHADNFNFPQPVRVHPEMPYFVFSPPVVGAFTITPGQVYMTRYRVVLFDGEPDKQKIEKLYQEYSKE
jgi:hypothetical protein